MPTVKKNAKYYEKKKQKTGNKHYFIHLNQLVSASSVCYMQICESSKFNQQNNNIVVNK